MPNIQRKTSFKDGGLKPDISWKAKGLGKPLVPFQALSLARLLHWPFKGSPGSQGQTCHASGAAELPPQQRPWEKRRDALCRGVATWNPLPPSLPTDHQQVLFHTVLMS